MKNRIVRNLLIISVIIILLGLLLGFGLTNYLINDRLQVNDRLLWLISIFGFTDSRLLFVIVSLGIVILIWIVYGIIILFHKTKASNFKSKNLIYIICPIILITVVGIIFSQLLLMTKVLIKKLMMV